MLALVAVTICTFQLMAMAMASVVLPQFVPGPRKVVLRSKELEGTGRPLRRRALSPVNLPLQDYFNGTDLQWFGAITVGTPPQDFTVVFDTQGFDLEITSTACGTVCSRQKKFDPSKSSTFVNGSYSESLSFPTGVGVDPVDGNNWTLNVTNATDTVSVAGLVTKDVEIFLITDQTPTFSPDPFDGILGLSQQASSIFQSLLDQGLPAQFGMWLTPDAVGQAELTLGGVDKTKFNGSLTFITQPSSDGNWVLPSTGISVNGKTTGTLKKQRTIAFDSGTSSLCLDKQTTEAIYAMISPDIKPVGKLGAYGIACDKISSLPAKLDFQFTAQSGEPFHLTVPSRELNVGPFSSDPSICQTFINAVDFNIIGGSLLKHYYSAWDLAGSRIGFAPNGF